MRLFASQPKILEILILKLFPVLVPDLSFHFHPSILTKNRLLEFKKLLYTPYKPTKKSRGFTQLTYHDISVSKTTYLPCTSHSNLRLGTADPYPALEGCEAAMFSIPLKWRGSTNVKLGLITEQPKRQKKTHAFLTSSRKSSDVATFDWIETGVFFWRFHIPFRFVHGALVGTPEKYKPPGLKPTRKHFGWQYSRWCLVSKQKKRGKKRQPHLQQTTTLQGINISPKNGILKIIFLFPRWDMWSFPGGYPTWPSLGFLCPSCPRPWEHNDNSQHPSAGNHRAVQRVMAQIVGVAPPNCDRALHRGNHICFFKLFCVPTRTRCLFQDNHSNRFLLLVPKETHN